MTKQTIFEADSNGLAIRGEAHTARRFLQDFTVEHFVFGRQVPDPECLVVADGGSQRFARVSRQTPQLPLTVTLKCREISQ